MNLILLLILLRSVSIQGVEQKEKCETHGSLNGSIKVPFEELRSFSPLISDDLGIPAHRELLENTFTFKVKCDKEVIVQLAQNAYPNSPYEMEKRDTQIDPSVLSALKRERRGNCRICDKLPSLFNCFELELHGTRKRTICHDFMIIQLHIFPLPHNRAQINISSVQHRVLLRSCNDNDKKEAIKCLHLEEAQESKIKVFHYKFNKALDLPKVGQDGYFSFRVQWKERDQYDNRGPTLVFGGELSSDPKMSFDFSKISINEEDDDKNGWKGLSSDVTKVSLQELFKPIYWALESSHGVQNLDYKIDCPLPKFQNLQANDIPEDELGSSRILNTFILIDILLGLILLFMIVFGFVYPMRLSSDKYE